MIFNGKPPEKTGTSMALPETLQPAISLLLNKDHEKHLQSCIQILVNEYAVKIGKPTFFVPAPAPSFGHRASRQHMWGKLASAVNSILKVPAAKIMVCMVDNVFEGAFVFCTDDSGISYSRTDNCITLQMATPLPAMSICRSTAELSKFIEACGGIGQPRKPDFFALPNAPIPATGSASPSLQTSSAPRAPRGPILPIVNGPLLVTNDRGSDTRWKSQLKREMGEEAAEKEVLAMEEMEWSETQMAELEATEARVKRTGLAEMEASATKT
jgi:hypothetical protein